MRDSTRKIKFLHLVSSLSKDKTMCSKLAKYLFPVLSGVQREVHAWQSGCKGLRRGRGESPERNREEKPFANEQDNLCQHVSTPYGTNWLDPMCINYFCHECMNAWMSFAALANPAKAAWYRHNISRLYSWSCQRTNSGYLPARTGRKKANAML